MHYLSFKMAGHQQLTHNPVRKLIMKTGRTFPLFALLVLLLLIPAAGYSSGFRLPESSVAGISLSNAIVANSDTAGALIYNPALMSAHQERRTVNAGLSNIRLDLNAKPDFGTSTDNKGQDSINLPNFYYMDRMSPDWAWGIGLDTPFGLITKWPNDTFPAYAGPLNPLGPYEPEASKIKMINITPNVSFKIDEHNFVALGLNYYDLKELEFSTQAIEIKGEGSASGYTLAYFYQRDAWSFGATYRSSVKVDVDGHIMDDGIALGIRADASAKITFPSMFQIGIRNKLNAQLAIEFDIERTNWSSFDEIEIKHKHPFLPNPISSTNKWDNVNAYRLGLTYQLNEPVQLRFGYTRDQTPQSDKYFSPRIPDADRQMISGGFAYAMNTDVNLEGGLMYIRLDDRTVSGSAGFDGKYTGKAYMLGLGITAKFDH